MNMKNNDFLSFFSACPGIAAAECRGATRSKEPREPGVNVMRDLRSILCPEAPAVVAQSAADGHHADLEWVASSTRTP